MPVESRREQAQHMELVGDDDGVGEEALGKTFEGVAHVDGDRPDVLAPRDGRERGLQLVAGASVHDLHESMIPLSEGAATAWWEALTGRGGEGMVVKPLGFVARGGRGLLQPAVKCRGPEYLRIIYGPEYDVPENLERLRSRGLSAKRSLALREFALGIEGPERFVRKEPLRRVHECVFGVLALESEPVDPRL
jgi:protein phosphatase